MLRNVLCRPFNILPLFGLYLLIMISVLINARNAQAPMHHGLEHVLGTCWKFERLISTNFEMLIATYAHCASAACLSLSGSTVSGVIILLHTHWQVL